MTLQKQNLPPGAQPKLGPEHREHPRARALKGAKIIFNDGSSVIDCMVRNTSSGGACVEVASLAGIPSHFTLLITPDVLQRECRVAWRRGNRMGLEYLPVQILARS